MISICNHWYTVWPPQYLDVGTLAPAILKEGLSRLADLIGLELADLAPVRIASHGSS